MERLFIFSLLAIGVIALLISKRGSGSEDIEDGCICQRIRDLYGVDHGKQEHYRRLVELVQQEDEQAARQLFQLAGSIGNHRPCWVARGDDKLKAAFCSVWPGVEAKASEQGWG